MTNEHEGLNPEFMTVQDLTSWLAESESVCRDAELTPVVRGYDGKGALVDLACQRAAFEGRCKRSWAAIVDETLGGKIIRLQNRGRCPAILRG